MDSKRSIDAAYEAYGQEFDDPHEFKSWLFESTQPPESHNFCWKDKFNDKPWEICRAPKDIPKFRMEFGLKQVEEKKGKKRKRKPKKRNNEFGRNFGGVMSHVSSVANGGAIIGAEQVRIKKIRHNK